MDVCHADDDADDDEVDDHDDDDDASQASKRSARPRHQLSQSNIALTRSERSGDEKDEMRRFLSRI